jgi:hypothetical protein
MAPTQRIFRSRTVAECFGVIVPILYAAVPVFAMLMATERVLTPPISSVARLLVVVALTVAGAYALCRMRFPPDVASNIVAVPSLGAALFPVMHSIMGRTELMSEGWYAWLYLVLLGTLLLIVARLGPSGSRSLHEALIIAAFAFLAFSLNVLHRAYVAPAYDEQVAAVLRRLSTPLPDGNNVTRRPDVLHLVLDSMGRPDVLQREYGLNVAPLVREFTEAGFDVWTDTGHANYVQTHLSLASMLNVTLLDDLTNHQGLANNREPLRYLVSNARIPEFFKRHGYEIEFIGTGSHTEGTFRVADRCDCPQLWIAGPEVGALGLTPLNVLLRSGLGHGGFYKRILHEFEAFERRSASDRPRYVFTHIMLPHPPFIIDQAGGFTKPRRMLSTADASFFPGTTDEYRNGYRAQVTFALRRTLTAINRILANARQDGREVLILMHGDHGPRLGMDATNPQAHIAAVALPVFLAIRWPYAAPPVERTPRSLVNVYRLVLGEFFNLQLPAVPDRAYISAFTTPYQVRHLREFDSVSSLDPTAVSGDR